MHLSTLLTSRFLSLTLNRESAAYVGLVSCLYIWLPTGGLSIRATVSVSTHSYHVIALMLRPYNSLLVYLDCWSDLVMSSIKGEIIRPCLSICWLLTFYSKLFELDEQLQVVTNNLKTLENSVAKVALSIWWHDPKRTACDSVWPSPPLRVLLYF